MIEVLLMQTPHGRAAIFCCLAISLAPCGCAGFRWGAGSLYRPDIRTVHVPVIQSDSLRRNLGERLTEAVVKEIELRTPYKVVSAASADSVLHVRIVGEGKRVIAENINDEPRDIEVDLGVGVSWIGRQGEPLIQRTAIPAPWLGTSIGQTANFVPEAGQSLALAQQEAIVKLAEQIVDQMEAPPY